MKNLKSYVFMAAAFLLSMLFLAQGEARAAGTDFYKRYKVEDGFSQYEFTLKANCSMELTMECSGHGNSSSSGEEEDEWDDWDENGFSVEIMNENFYTVFDKTMYKDGVYRKTKVLNAGTYEVFMDGDEKCRLTLSGKYIPTLSAYHMTLEAGKTENLSVLGTKKKVVWNSSKPSVASVNNKGVVEAKKAGTAVISAKCNGYTLKCRVTVERRKATYSAISRELKEFAGKHADLTFKNVDVGRKCRLYGKMDAWRDGSKIWTEGYFMICSYQPYIELVKKKNGKVEMQLRMEGYLEEQSIYSTSVYCKELRIYSSNRRLKVPLKQTSGYNTRNYSNNIYVGRMRGYSILLTTAKADKETLKKFQAMTGQGSMRVKILSSNGDYFDNVVTQSGRKSWGKLAKQYEKIWKDYYQ